VLLEEEDMAKGSSRFRLMGGIGALLLLAATAASDGWVVGTADAAQEDEEDEEEFPGVDGDAYESPTYGYAIEWDEDDWVVDAAGSREGVDSLTLLTEESVDREVGEDEHVSISLLGTDTFDGDIEECLEEVMEEWEDAPIAADFAVDEDHDRPELPELPELEEAASEQFTYVLYPDEAAEEWVHFAVCLVLVEDESVLRIEYRATEPAFEEWLDAANDVLASLELAERGQG
jgi:hypothetical protein